MEEVRSYRTFSNSMSMLDRMRARVRRGALAGLSLTSRISGGDWIRFPYYHHVFDDERVAFERQLRYLRSFGEFISMDDAVRMLTAATPIDGRYFCVSFDDGFANCRSNMLPITAALDVPVIIDIYPAREEPIAGVSSQTIYDRMKNPNKEYLKGEDWISWIIARRPRVFITLGAGDLDKHIPELIRQLYKNETTE